MPKYRQLHCRIVESFSVNDMPDDLTRLIWILLPIALDCEGRGIYSPAWVRSKIMPLRKDVTDDQISNALAWFEGYGKTDEKPGMIVAYNIDGHDYFYIPTWHEYQTGTKHEAPSHIPAPEQVTQDIPISINLPRTYLVPTSDLPQQKLGSITSTSTNTSASAKAREPTSDSFSGMQALLETLTGYPITPLPKEIEAIDRYVAQGVTEADIRAALAFYRDNGRVARGAAALEKSIMYAKAQRLQAINAQAPPDGRRSATIEDLGYKWIDDIPAEDK